jgi:MOSC domain-containing protein YiiM
LGENLTTRGIDRRSLRAGQRFRVGSAVIELTKVRGPCATLDIYGPEIKREIYDAQVRAGDFASPLWAMSGFYAAVVQPGVIRANDIITLESELA